MAGTELGGLIMVLELLDALCRTSRWSWESDTLSLEDKLSEEDEGGVFLSEDSLDRGVYEARFDG